MREQKSRKKLSLDTFNVYNVSVLYVDKKTPVGGRFI